MGPCEEQSLTGCLQSAGLLSFVLSLFLEFVIFSPDTAVKDGFYMLNLILLSLVSCSAIGRGGVPELPLAHFQDLVLPSLQGRDGLQRHSPGLRPENLMQILKVTPQTLLWEAHR